ncbi:cochlin [Polymixia lowei]
MELVGVQDLARGHYSRVDACGHGGLNPVCWLKDASVPERPGDLQGPPGTSRGPPGTSRDLQGTSRDLQGTSRDLQGPPGDLQGPPGDLQVITSHHILILSRSLGDSYITRGGNDQIFTVQDFDFLCECSLNRPVDATGHCGTDLSDTEITFLWGCLGSPQMVDLSSAFTETPPTYSDVTVPSPVSCVTRGADLLEDGVVVLCPPDCSQWRVSVFGTGIYASVSSVCGAAVHRGVVGAGGGSVRVHKMQGRHSYMSSYSNGIQSQALSHWTSSFSLTRPVNVPQELTSQTSTTALPAAVKPVKKSVKKPSVKKALTGGNRDCQMEIAVVIDSSKNIGQRRFNLQKNFVTKLVSILRIGPSGPHVGLVQAGDSPRTEFYLANHTQPKELLFAIKELVYMGGDTNTGKAILYTAETFFTPERGVRRGHPRVMVVLVDGWPSDDLEHSATLARESGINVFLVSVAKAAPEELSMVRDKDFMKKAVCKDNGFFNYLIPSWFSTTKHVKPLTQRLCSLDGLLCSKTCYNSVNIGFLIDGSSSVGDGNFRLVLEFLAAIARSFDISDVGARIGAVQFTYDQRLEFGLYDHSDKESAINAVRRIPYMSGGTATGEAITYTAKNLFRKTGPGRNFLILVTDGQSYDDVRNPSLAAQQQGITIFSVGVAWAPLDDLKVMSSEPKESHTFFSREFNGLSEFAQPIVRGICRDFTEAN